MDPILASELAGVLLQNISGFYFQKSKDPSISYDFTYLIITLITFLAMFPLYSAQVHPGDVGSGLVWGITCNKYFIKILMRKR